MTEIWKDIRGYEGIYEVSNYGRVRSLDRIDARGHRLRARIRKPNTVNEGYLRINLYKDGVVKTEQVSLLVLEAFVGTKPKDHFIRFIDGNRGNASLDNIEYSWLNALNTTGLKGVFWEKNKKKWIARIDRDRKRIFLGAFETKQQAHEACEAFKNDKFKAKV